MKTIKLVLTDVNRCITDGWVYYGHNHESIKSLMMKTKLIWE